MSSAMHATRNVVALPFGDTAFWTYQGSQIREDLSDVPVVLVHGFRGDHHGLEVIASQVHSSRVVIPDLPGFGSSERLRGNGMYTPHTLANLGQWLTSFTDTICDQPFVLVGHSFGTLVVASSLAQDNDPDHVVIINPISSPALEGPRAILSKFALSYYRLGQYLPAKVGNAVLKNPTAVRFMSEVMTKTTDKQLRAWIHEQHNTYFSNFSDPQSLFEAFNASISHTVQEFSDVFSQPTTIITGDRDDITPLSEQLKLMRRIRNAQLFIVPEAGHLIHYEHPQQVSAAINRILKHMPNASRNALVR